MNTFFIGGCEKSGFRIDRSSIYRIRRAKRALLEKSENLRKEKFDLRNKVYYCEDTYGMRDCLFVAANLDGLAQLENGKFVGLEIKISSYKVGWKKNNIPRYYWN